MIFLKIFFKDFFPSKNLKLLQQGFGAGPLERGWGLDKMPATKFKKRDSSM